MCYNVHIATEPINRLDLVHGLEKQDVHLSTIWGRCEHGSRRNKSNEPERPCKVP
jgi:hypothetical protein